MKYSNKPVTINDAGPLSGATDNHLAFVNVQVLQPFNHPGKTVYLCDQYN